MHEFRGKVAIIVGVLYFAFVAWPLYGALVPVETHTFRIGNPKMQARDRVVDFKREVGFGRVVLEVRRASPHESLIAWQ